MIALPAGARILLATKPVDFRKGAHSLAALAAEVLGADPFSGAVLVFRSRRADRIKILVWDGSGLVVVWKQLEGSAFRWPAIVDGVLRLTPVEFAALFDGIDWRRVQDRGRFPSRARLHRIARTMRVAAADMPTLPEDSAALRALLLSVIAERDSLAAERDALAARNEQLHHLLLKLKRRQFGAKSERLPEDQLLFAFEEIEATLAGNAAEAGKASPTLHDKEVMRMADEARLRRFAVLTDADNTSPRIAPGLFEEIAKFGEASVRRIYGDFSSHRLKSWIEIL